MNFNKVCELEDFADPELAAVIRDLCGRKAAHLSPDFPVGAEARKDWEVAMTVRALRHFGAMAPDAKILGVGAGTEDTIFYLSRHVGQVFVTDRYLDAGSWSPVAPVAMLVEPAFLAPFDFDPQRLVVQHMDARALRYPDETFDGIFSSGSIEHFGDLEDIANAAYEMGRVLKPGGVVALSTEFRFSGPPGGVGWPGRTLLLSETDIQRYIVEASGLEPVDELRPEASDETMATRRDLNQAMADHDARLADAAGRDVPEYACWDFPHIVLVHDGYVFGSVHLTLRRSEAHPCTPNGWAEPGARTLSAIAAANREILTAGNRSTPSDEAPASPPPPPPVEHPPAEPSWEERQAAAADEHAAATAHAHSAAAQLGAIAAHRVEVERQVADIARQQADVERLLGTVSRLRAEVGRWPPRRPLAADRLAGDPEPDRSTWTSSEANLGGGRTVTVMVDGAADDPVSGALASGQALDQDLVALMLEMVRPGDVVLDLGAHIGTFALAAAAHGAVVVAVEASSENAALLRASASSNRFHSLQVVAAAASDRPGTVEFSPRGPWGHVATPTAPLPARPVLAVTVDELLTEMGLPAPAFVKMDIEGSEVAALKGMRRLLERDDAPPVLYESNGHTLAFFGTTPEQLVAEFGALGYTSYLVESDRLVRIDPDEMQPQTEVNCLALKRRPETLRRWQFAPPLTLGERAARMAADCRSPNPDHRVYIARALRTADPAVLSHPVVAEALTSLHGDPEPAVREAVGWWPGAETSGGTAR